MAATRPRLIAALLCGALATGILTGGQPHLRRVRAIDLPGPPGRRLDYLSIDYVHHYLFSAHLGAGQLYVIDLRQGRVVATIPDLPGIEAAEPVPDLNKVFTSNWYENKIAVIDLSTTEVTKKIPTEAKPDGIAYAAPFHKLYVSAERGRGEAVVDARKDRVVTTLHFNSETGMPQYDAATRRVFVNLQDQNRLAEIDPATDAVVGAYPAGRCRGNHGLALDVKNRRAFLACEGNDLLAVFDLERHRVVTTLPLPAGADVVKFDPGLRRVYVACGSGAIAIVQEDDADHFRLLEDFPVPPRVHSLVVDVETHRVYAAAQEEDGKPQARLLVYEP